MNERQTVFRMDGTRFVPSDAEEGGYSGNPPGPPTDMEARLTKLEALAEKTGERLGAIEKDVAVMRSNYATKEDLHKEISSQTWKLITWVTGLFTVIGGGLVAASYFIAKHVT